MPVESGTCVWTFEDGIWTVLDHCSPGFECGDPPGKVGGDFILQETVDTPNGPVKKLSIAQAHFRDHVVAVLRSVGRALTPEEDQKLAQATNGVQFEVPCVESETPEPDAP